MPLHGGLMLDTSAMDKIKWLADGVIRVEAGKKMLDLETETRPEGWELRVFPSTRRTATIGGFIAGGSSGVGAITYGNLVDRGSINALRVVTCEETPRVIELVGDEVQKVNHAYGTNGVITELELPMAPVFPWVDIVVTFDDFMQACRFCQALALADGCVKKEIAPIDASLTGCFPTLRNVVPAGQHIVIVMIAEPSLQPFEEVRDAHGGVEVYRKSEAEIAAENLIPLYEYTWNHTTLYALKMDPTITYLQSLFAAPDHLEKIEHMIERFGDEVPMHLEFVRQGDTVGCFGLQIVRYTDEARLNEIIAYHEDNGCPIFNPHTYILEDGGMKEVDPTQLDFKRDADPYGLMNPGKMRAWKDGE